MRLARLDLNLLVCLDAILAERNVSKAARRVFLSQPAMSAALARIRRHFEDDIVVQIGRAMVITPFAQNLIEPVRDAILRLRAIAALRPNFDPRTSEMKVSIQASDYVATTYFSKVIERVWREAPGVQIDLRLLGTNYVELLDSGEVDLLVIPQGILQSPHPSAPLFTDTWSCVVWKGNTIVGDRITRQQYLRMGHVMTAWDGGRLQSIDENLLARGGMSRHREVVAPSFSLAPQFVVKTNRVATVQTRMAHMLAMHWPLRVLPCPIRIPLLRERVHWHAHQEHDPALAWFRKIMIEVASGIRSERQ